ncbi:hypothetical protein RDWZM_002527 [Blomia tropicalis]|uniref:RING-type domain-containing protein n=1 Tax=Blomia tropicalis TaxID=40697 RepID=A0A9Q0MGI2_BLOTA|nr:hypothetical protein BLOT_001675 [Blomia tropicalis]KAJ6223982.1 hypothetical protein RDWZM_002527 [Blomia tropicalis]
MEAQQKLRQQALLQFKCPYMKVNNNDFCILSETTGCPFGHGTNGESSLLSIPSYICHDHLLQRCSSTEYDHQNKLSQCKFGLHPTLEDLLMIDRLPMKMASILLSSQTTQVDQLSNGDDAYDSNQCGVCFEPIIESKRLFGLLEQCTHVFCANCIAKWRLTTFLQMSEESSNNFLSCPLCRIKSKRVLIWPYALSSIEKRKNILDLQDSCTFVSTHQVVIEDEDLDDDNDDSVIDEENSNVRRITAEVVFDSTTLHRLLRPFISLMQRFQQPPNQTNRLESITQNQNDDNDNSPNWNNEMDEYD